MGNTGLISGANGLASEVIRQSAQQAKYDGSATLGRQTIRYGFGLNRINAAGYVPVQSLAPVVNTNVGPSEEASAQTGPFPSQLPHAPFGRDKHRHPAGNSPQHVL